MRMVVLFPDDVRPQIEAAAKADGLQMSVWVRSIVMKQLGASASAAPKEKVMTDKQKQDAWRDKIEARFGKGKVIGKDWLAPYDYTVYVDVRRAIRKPESDAMPFKGNEGENDLRKIIGWWKELGGDYAHAKRLYGERALAVAQSMRLSAKQMIEAFDDLWDDVEPEQVEGW